MLSAEATTSASQDPPTTNPLNASETLVNANNADATVSVQDSATTKAEKVERNGLSSDSNGLKRKLEPSEKDAEKDAETTNHGETVIKSEYVLNKKQRSADNTRDPKKKKQGGQNTNRRYGSSRDALQLCMSRATSDEFSPAKCSFGDKCKHLHDVRHYLKDGKREDLETFGKACPVWVAQGYCPAGWRCRFAGSHSDEKHLEDGRTELVLLKDEARYAISTAKENDNGEGNVGVVNIVAAFEKIDLRKRKRGTPKADVYNQWLEKVTKHSERETKKESADEAETSNTLNGNEKKDNRAQYIEPPFLPSEKRRLYYGPETPVLAPLTTQGNLPFRRLCVGLGAQVTWSEMAMGLPLIQGEKSEWALMKAHESEIQPPTFKPKQNIVYDYNNSRDLKFGAQIAANKPWQALKATEVLTTLCPHLRAIDLNCGCPIELVTRQGAGSALMDSAAKLEKMLRGMNAVSGEVPITVKIRTGTKNDKPTADKLVQRLANGGIEAHEQSLGPSGVAAITLHGRSRQQRYTRNADWSYVAECAAIIKGYNNERDDRLDTIKEQDDRLQSSSNGGRIYFIGNGDCYSHVDYNTHLEEANVDSVMIARGALVKPWIFEEIEKGQYLDKSSSERLAYIEQFTRYGLQTWGSDEIGVGTTRRFLLEWLSFACRYVPHGLLERLPPRLQDRPPAFRGRDDMETLLSSDNFRDWIKISEMFLGPTHKDFHFEPKHRSNSYEIEAEG